MADDAEVIEEILYMPEDVFREQPEHQQTEVR